MLSAFDVADYFLKLADDEAGEYLSNLKLQKLLYYAQGFHLAAYNEPIFDTPVLAWTYGPAVPPVYHKFGENMHYGIKPPDDTDFSFISQDVRELLDDVYYVYGQFSGWKLSELTHREPPCADTEIGEEIPYDRMKAYFKTQLEEQDDGEKEKGRQGEKDTCADRT